MSKLYNALSRLDAIASLQETSSATMDIPFKQALNNCGASLRRLLVLSGTFILLGVIAVGITAYWQDWFDLHLATNIATPLPPESTANTTNKTEEKASSPISAAAATPLAGEIQHQPSENEVPPPQAQRVDHQTSLAKGMVDATPATVISRLPAKAVKKILSRETKHFVSMDIVTEPKPLQLMEQIESPDTATEQFIDQTAQQSRWLHQAEERRRVGDYSGAIALFTKVWQISGNPSVANNLAASLMQMNRWSEAEKILTKALKQAPGDQDLQQNLRVAQQLAGN